MSDLEQKLSALEPGRPAAATVGTFDGVHLGHRRLLSVLRNEAAREGLASIAITFEKQPRSHIDPTFQASYLATLEYRIELIRSTGVDMVLPALFDDELRQKSAQQFLQMLQETTDVRVLVSGPGARLGHDRQTADELQSVARELGIRIVEVSGVNGDDGTVSSSAIRAALQAGNVKTAAKMLGRSYRVDGTVVTGDRRGRELGFPTANIQPAGQLATPANGIYATLIEIEGVLHKAATSVGVRPTFGPGERMIEAYVLDFEGDLYGKTVKLEFIERLREEVKFDGVEKLVEQMNRDVAETRTVLGRSI